MTNPSVFRYTSDHEWVLIDGDIATIGITPYAQNALGDVVYLSLPEIGTLITAGDAVGEIESTKSVGDLFTPVSGEITEVNQEARDNTQLLNSDPLGAGWLVRVRFADLPDDLLDEAAYRELTGE